MTVAELIDALKVFPPHFPVFISDADTSWDLNFRVHDAVNSVCLEGNYGDKEPDEPNAHVAEWWRQKRLANRPAPRQHSAVIMWGEDPK